MCLCVDQVSYRLKALRMMPSPTFSSKGIGCNPWIRVSWGYRQRSWTHKSFEAKKMKFPKATQEEVRMARKPVKLAWGVRREGRSLWTRNAVKGGSLRGEGALAAPTLC